MRAQVECQGPGGIVVAVSSSPTHTLAKQNRPGLSLLAGLGVEGDAHCGETVRHRHQVRRAPDRPNLCQVHWIHAELIAAIVHRPLRRSEQTQAGGAS